MPKVILNRGSVLVFSLIILTIILVSALSLATAANRDRKASITSTNSNQAFYVADSGLQATLQKIYKTTQPTLNDMAVALGGACTAGGVGIPATIAFTAAGGNSTVSFFSGVGGTTPYTDCTATDWRNNVTKIKSEGEQSGDHRAIEVAVAPADCGTVNDADGNTYNTVIIGTQCWMKQNMRVGTYISAPTVQSNNSIIEKYCRNNDSNNCMAPSPPWQPDGGFYMWGEAMQYSTTAGAQGICPVGWHIPTDGEWHTLEDYLKDSGQTCNASRNSADCASAGTKLKPFGTSGFEGNLAGEYFGNFGDYNNGGTFWSSSINGELALGRSLASGPNSVYRQSFDRLLYGLSVRCVR